MADSQVGNIQGVNAVATGDADTLPNFNGGTDMSIPWDDTDLTNLSTMRTRLAAIDGAFYTAAKLNTMTINDMIYAIRVNDSPTTVL